MPAGFRLRADPCTRLVAGGSVLVGGSPVRVLRLTPAGGRQVACWFAGAPVPEGVASRKLARRLLDAGLAHPVVAAQAADRPRRGGAQSAVQGTEPADSGSADSRPGGLPVTVVIPVRDRHAELARCLAGARAGGLRVIVVDDASADPRAIAAIAVRHGADVLRRPVNGGPGAARNTGLAAAATELVAFLDSDCVPRSGWLGPLLPHFADPAVGAVAPRIAPHQPGRGWLARYEGASSTLDMGARPSIVRPGARVSYVPGAALVVRKSAAGDGFAPGLVVGEDVDFVWRMAAAGWRVRYEPAAVMGHDHRVTFRAWFSRRADYGTSAAVLEQLHPAVVRPLYASWWTVGAWAAALSGRPVTAAALTGTATALLARRLSRVTGERWPVPAVAPSIPIPNNSKKAAGRRRWLRAAGKILEERWSYSVLFFRQNQSLPQPLDNSKKRGSAGGSSAGGSSAAQSSAAGPFAGGSPSAGGSLVAWPLAVRLAGGGTLAAGRPLGSAISRTWWPVAIPAAVAFPRLRRPLAALILVPPLLDWADRRPPLDPVRYCAARLLDDAAYSLGVWQGCLARRTLRPLLPVIGPRPGNPPSAAGPQ